MCVKDLSEKASERAGEKERMRDYKNKFMERSEKKDYNLSNLVKIKKSIISSTLYHSVILAFIRAFEFEFLASRRLFLYRDCPLSSSSILLFLFVFFLLPFTA